MDILNTGPAKVKRSAQVCGEDADGVCAGSEAGGEEPV